MRLSQLMNETANLTIDVKGSEIHVTYRPNFITVEVEDALHDIGSGDSKNRVKDLFAILCSVLTQWDVTDDNDVVVPLEVDELASHGVTLELANVVLDAVMSDSTRVNP